MTSKKRLMENIKSYLRPTYHCLRAISKREHIPTDSYWALKFDPTMRKNKFKIDLSHQPKMVKEAQYLCNRHMRMPFMESSSDWYFNEPIRPNTVLVLGLGKSVRGNMQYVLNELNYSKEFEGFEIYIRASLNTFFTVREFIAKNHWTRTHIVVTDREYNMLLASVKYLITEVYFPEAWAKKPGQIYINIWHGTPLKKLGLAKNFRTSHRNGVTQRNFIDADYLLYPNEYTRDHMLESYKVSQLMNGKILLLGYPRTGGMLAAAEEDLENVRKKLSPGGEKIYAYMPTFRDYLNLEESLAQTKELLDHLEANMNDHQILYVNLHHKLNDSLNYSVYKKIKKFPSDIDSYRLLAASEALISDYSSVFFDYLALQKQIILYIPDFKKYSRKRGMYMDLLELPFDKAYKPAEVIEAMNRGKQYDDTNVWEQFCRYDTPQNASKLCSLLTGQTADLDLQEIPHDDRTRALIFSEAMQPGPETELLHEYTRYYDRTAKDIYLCCNSNAVDENIESAYPMLFENPVIGSEFTSRTTALGRALRALYKEKKIPFAQAMGYLQYDYALMTKRVYGNAKFDVMVIYDPTNCERFLELSVISAPKVLFLQQSALDRIFVKNERFIRDCILFASKYCRSICVLTEKQKELAESFLPDCWKGKVQIVDTPEKMDQVIFPQ